MDVVSMTYSGATATVTTAVPHRRLVGDWVIISGAVDSNGLPDANYNGSFKETQPLTVAPRSKAFNNQKRAGTLLHAYPDAPRYLMELQDFTEDSLL